MDKKKINLSKLAEVIAKENNGTISIAFLNALYTAEQNGLNASDDTSYAEIPFDERKLITDGFLNHEAEATLVLLAKCGDKDATEKLIKAYNPLIKSKVNKVYKNNKMHNTIGFDEFNDYISIANIAFLETIQDTTMLSENAMNEMFYCKLSNLFVYNFKHDFLAQCMSVFPTKIPKNVYDNKVKLEIYCRKNNIAPHQITVETLISAGLKAKTNINFIKAAVDICSKFHCSIEELYEVCNDEDNDDAYVLIDETQNTEATAIENTEGSVIDIIRKAFYNLRDVVAVQDFYYSLRGIPLVTIQQQRNYTHYRIYENMKIGRALFVEEFIRLNPDMAAEITADRVTPKKSKDSNMGYRVVTDLLQDIDMGDCGIPDFYDIPEYEEERFA